MRRSVLSFSILAAVLISMAGCGGPSVASRDTLDRFKYDVARFDPDYTMTADQLYRYVFHTRYEPEGGIVDEATIREVLDSVLVDTICGLEARDFNLRDNWLQHFVYLGQVNDHLHGLYWNEIIRPRITWDSAEVVQYYEDHIEDFHVDEQVNLYHIFCSPRGWDKGPDSLKMREYSKPQLWDLAEEYCRNVYRVLSYGEPFQNAAFVLSHDITSREKGGFIGWTTRGIYKDPFDSVAFSLEPYEYSIPYKDEHGWHIIYNEGYVAEGTAPIDTPSVFVSARQSLTGSKYKRLTEQIIDSLRAHLQLEINPEILDTNIYRVDDSIWTGVVGGVDTISARELKMLEEPFRKRYGVDSTTAELRKEMVRAVADRYLVVEAARAHGLDTLPEAVKYRDHIWHAKCKMLLLESPYNPDWEPTDSMVQQYYDDHIEEYQPSQPLKAEHLRIEDSSLAEFLAEQVRAGVDLQDLKKEWGDDQGYEIDYREPRQFGRADVAEEYYIVASRSIPMVGAQVAGMDSAFYVIRVLENRSPILLPMAKGGIRTQLKVAHKRQEYEQFRDSLFQLYDVRFTGKLKGAEVPMLAYGRLRPFPGQ